MFEPAGLCGCCGYLAWLWIQNFTCLLNACPPIPLRGPLPFLPSAIRANTWEIIRFQVVEWLGLVPCSYYPRHGHHWGHWSHLTAQPVRAATEWWILLLPPPKDLGLQAHTAATEGLGGLSPWWHTVDRLRSPFWTILFSSTRWSKVWPENCMLCGNHKQTNTSKSRTLQPWRSRKGKQIPSYWILRRVDTILSFPDVGIK